MVSYCSAVRPKDGVKVTPRQHPRLCYPEATCVIAVLPTNSMIRNDPARHLPASSCTFVCPDRLLQCHRGRIEGASCPVRVVPPSSCVFVFVGHDWLPRCLPTGSAGASCLLEAVPCPGWAHQGSPTGVLVLLSCTDACARFLVPLYPRGTDCCHWCRMHGHCALGCVGVRLWLAAACIGRARCGSCGR